MRAWLEGNRRILRAAGEFLTEVRKTPINDELAVSREWLAAAVAAPTFDPTDTTLRTAVATGRIELLADVDLRIALAHWRQQPEDTQADELLIREIVVGQLVPVLSRQVRPGGAFEFDPMIDWFAGRRLLDAERSRTITVSSELEGALAEKVFYTHFVVQGLAAIHETQDNVLEQRSAAPGAR